MLFGDHNPSGKLPMSFPRSVGKIPIYYNHLPTGLPYDPQKPEKYTSHYYDEANSPLFPFGYGLSYTHFTLSPVTLSATQLAPAGSLTATVTLTNDGDRDGATVVQLYLHDVTAFISRPVATLREFHKVFLKAGASQSVQFTVTPAMLRFIISQCSRSPSRVRWTL